MRLRAGLGQPLERGIGNGNFVLTGAGDHLPRTYIYCTRAAPGDVFGQFAERARSEAGWRCLDLDASHSPNVTAPAALADLLAEIAG